MENGEATKPPIGLKLLRQPFADHQIGKLPKPTRAQTDEVKANFRAGIRCNECGGWHHPNVVHLDYVGHAALTDRLLDVDPAWNWEPFATTETGLPQFDNQGGLWIKLTVLGVTRMGYGATDKNKGGDGIKEIIGDALRNAAMRFGVALNLWHKGDLHITEPDDDLPEKKAPAKPPVDIEKLQTGAGIKHVASFDTAQAAIDRARLAFEVSEKAAALIVDIWEAERNPQ